jgi:hypothetical protein
MQPRNGTVVIAHLGRAGQERKMDPHGMTRLVEWSSGWRWVTVHPARARRRVMTARVFISPKAAGAPIYLYFWESSLAIYSARALAAAGGLSAPGVTATTL